MNQLVYLHELDSVRNTTKEIELAHKVLYEEIMGNGNTVVLSFNQVTDSKAFLSLIFADYFKNYEHILTLFEHGALKVSRYKTNPNSYRFKGTHLHDHETEIEVRTPAQYLIAALADNISKAENANGSGYIFSALPIQSRDIVSIRTIYRAFVYSDPEIIRTLFRPQDYPTAEQKKCLPKDDKEKDRKIEQIYQYTKFILEISKMQSSANPCISDTTYRYRLDDFILHTLIADKDKIASHLDNYAFDTALFEDAIQTLNAALDNFAHTGTASQSVNINSRSVWYAYFQNNSSGSDAQILAKALIDIAYNYVVESSIHHVSKHYNPQNKNSLQRDLAKRICSYWNEYQMGIHPAHAQSTDELELTDMKVISFETPARTKSTMPQRFTKTTKDDSVSKTFRYEDNYSAQQIHWSLDVFLTFLKTIAVILYVGCITYATDSITDAAQELIAEQIMDAISNPLLYAFVTDILLFMVVFAFLNSALTSFLSAGFQKLFDKELNIPELVESIINSFYLILGFIKSVFHKDYSYKRMPDSGEDEK